MSSIVIVTSAAWQPVLPDEQPGSLATVVTLPTLMPAIRTSEFGWIPLAAENTAWTVNWLESGFANFVNPRYVITTIAMIPISPALKRLMPRLRPRRRLIGIPGGSRTVAGRSAGYG